MAFCNNNMELIDRNECIGNSLTKINENFLTLDNSLCQLSASFFGPLSANTLSAANVGLSGIGVYKQTTNNTLQFKKIAGGTDNVTVAEDNDVLKISVTDLTVVSAVNVGSGTGIVLKDSVQTPISFRTISGGSNTTVATVGDNIIISSTNAVSGVNVGIGAGKVYATNLGNNLQFKSIKAGSNVTIVNSPNDIEISASGGGGGTTLLISDTPPPTTTQGQLWFDSSSGVTSVYYGSSWVDVGGGDSSGGSGEATTASNLGTVSDGVGLFTSKSGSDLPFKRIKAGTNVSIAEGTNSITINAGGGSGGGGTVTSVAGTYPIIVANGTTSPSISIANATTASAGAMTAADKLRVDSAVINSQNIAGSTGEGSIVPSVTKVGSNLQFKRIKAGSGVTITDSATDVTVSAGGVPTGMVMYYSSPSAPTGWIECNGATIPNSGSTANLYAFLQSAGNPFGGAGKIPDLRGRFIRSNGSDGTYSSGTFGATQGDAIRNITGVVSGNSMFFDGASGAFALGTTKTGGQPPATANNRTDDFSFDASRVVPTASENRPANVALLACIKL